MGRAGDVQGAGGALGVVVGLASWAGLQPGGLDAGGGVIAAHGRDVGGEVLEESGVLEEAGVGGLAEVGHDGGVEGLGEAVGLEPDVGHCGFLRQAADCFRAVVLRRVDAAEWAAVQITVGVVRFAGEMIAGLGEEIEVCHVGDSGGPQTWAGQSTCAFESRWTD